MVNDIVKKTFILILALIIATYMIIEYFEEGNKTKEGMSIGITMLGNMASNMPVNAAAAASSLSTALSGQAIGASQRMGIFGAKVVQDAGISGAETAERGAYKGVDTAEKTQIAFAAELSRRQEAIKAEISRKITAVKENVRDTIARVKASVMRKINYIHALYVENKTTLYYIWLTGFALIVLALFGFLKKVFKWAICTVKCLIKRFQNFKNCFFWYLLEIVGQILYLPIRLIVWMGGKTFSRYEKKFWKLLYAIDCKIYDIGGFHVFHFPESVQQKCYDCRFKPFPNIIAHFEEVKKNKDVMGTFRSIIGF
jgi:hypothetical protein